MCVCVCVCVYFHSYVVRSLEKKYLLENSHVLSCFVQLKAFSSTSRVFCLLCFILFCFVFIFVRGRLRTRLKRQVRDDSTPYRRRSERLNPPPGTFLGGERVRRLHRGYCRYPVFLVYECVMSLKDIADVYCVL